jgi:hypothetical protein
MKHAVPTAPAVESQSMLQCQSHAQIAVHIQPAAAADATVVTAPKGTAAAARTMASSPKHAQERNAIGALRIKCLQRSRHEILAEVRKGTKEQALSATRCDTAIQCK